MPAPFALTGFSAGAQFAHRYAMRFPGQVTSLVSVSAGWYTLPYTNLAYPFGCAPSVDLPEGIQDIDKFLRIPTRVMVGENDIKRNMWLRTSPALDESQGSHRLGRAQSWVEAVSRTATARNITASISLEILPNCGHSSITAIRRGHLVQRSISFLTSNPAAE
jgi:pimeloyl-ACP methyl ester carboxylesterase